MKHGHAIDTFSLLLGEANLVKVDYSCIPHLISNLIENLSTATRLVAGNTYHLAATTGVERVGRVIFNELFARLTLLQIVLMVHLIALELLLLVMGVTAIHRSYTSQGLTSAAC